MNAQALARDYLRKGRARRRALQVLFDEGSYDDVGGTVKEFAARLPDGWRVRLDDIETISRTLFEERGHAFYGDEASLTPASALFGDADARRAITWVDELMGLFEALLQESPSDTLPGKRPT